MIKAEWTNKDSLDLQPTCNQLATDLISRQDAIDAICKDWCNSKHKDCKTPFNQEIDEYYHCDGCGDIETLLALPSAEPPYQYSEAYVMQIRGERDILQDMVNNMAEQKTGEWIAQGDCGVTKCNRCGWSIEECIDYNYCPNCGAKMRGEEE